MCLALPAKIVSFPETEASIAVVDVLSVERRVNIELLRGEPLEIGDWVLLHVGFAMAKINEADARDQLEILAMLGEADEAQQGVAS